MFADRYGKAKRSYRAARQRIFALSNGRHVPHAGALAGVSRDALR